MLILIESTSPEHLRELFQEVTVIGKMNTPYAMPFENRRTIFLVRGPKFGDLQAIWPKKKGYI